MTQQHPLAEPVRRLWTVRETASQLSISVSILYELMGAGRIKFVKLGRRTFFEETAIQAFLTSLRVTR